MPMPTSLRSATKRKPAAEAAGANASLRAAKRSSASKRSRSADPAVEPAHYIEPMKALGVDEISGDDWLLEIKYDGYRALAVRRGKVVELWSRNEKPLAANYSKIAQAVGKLRCKEAILDGEIVALDEAGRPKFQLLQGSESETTCPPLFYYLFDLLQLNGRSFLQEPIEVRREALQKLLKSAPEALRLSPTFDEKPGVLLEAVRQQGLEGIVGKRRGSLYEPGRRSGVWVKKRLALDQEFVIGGYTPPKGGRTHLGALLVGFYEGDQLMYAGKVGTGFNARLLAALHQRFSSLKRSSTSFSNLPTKRPRFGQGMTASAMREVTWLEPELVCQVRFSEWTRDAMLRQPVFLGLREDKRAREVVRESTSSSPG